MVFVISGVWVRVPIVSLTPPQLLIFLLYMCHVRLWWDFLCPSWVLISFPLWLLFSNGVFINCNWAFTGWACIGLFTLSSNQIMIGKKLQLLHYTVFYYACTILNTNDLLFISKLWQYSIKQTLYNFYLKTNTPSVTLFTIAIAVYLVESRDLCTCVYSTLDL